jgi:NNP family nitrate/nitrite transporter-like MFS transporter
MFSTASFAERFRSRGFHNHVASGMVEQPPPGVPGHGSAMKKVLVESDSQPVQQSSSRTPMVMLVTATIGFAVNFWAWALISPLGALYLKQGADSPLGLLSQSEVALMVAVPVLVGSLGRIIVGALTDRFGGRVMFPIVSAATIVPVLFLAFFALDSYSLMLFGGFFLGIAGTAFAVGVPFVNA